MSLYGLGGKYGAYQVSHPSDTGVQETHDSQTEDEKDLKWGGYLLISICLLLFIMGWIYLYYHFSRPVGYFAPTTMAAETVKEAKKVLSEAKADVLETDAITELTRLSDKLVILVPQISADTEFSTTLDQINTELKGGGHVTVLNPLFNRLESLILIGTGEFFWSGRKDLWLELIFWCIAGTLVFLLSEIKRWWTIPYKQKGRSFKNFTPWYAANFFRGPFIAIVILLALTSISFDAIGISIDFKSAPVVLIVLAAVLGYYARVADKQLDIISKKLLPDAWGAAKPEEELPVIEPKGVISLKANQTQEFTVRPNLQVQWFLKGEGKLKDGKYTAPDRISEAANQVIVLAQVKDNKFKIDMVEITLVSDNEPASGGGNNSPTKAEPTPVQTTGDKVAPGLPMEPQANKVTCTDQTTSETPKVESVTNQIASWQVQNPASKSRFVILRLNNHGFSGKTLISKL